MEIKLRKKKREKKKQIERNVNFCVNHIQSFFFVLIVQTIIVPNLPVHHGSTGIPAVTFDDKISEKV